VAKHVGEGAACRAPLASFRSYYVGVYVRPVASSTPAVPRSPSMVPATGRPSARAVDGLPGRTVADGG
jgi:hypothetical protein